MTIIIMRQDQHRNAMLSGRIMKSKRW